jgi:hypothetical protein
VATPAIVTARMGPGLTAPLGPPLFTV